MIDATVKILTLIFECFSRKISVNVECQSNRRYVLRVTNVGSQPVTVIRAGLALNRENQGRNFCQFLPINGQLEVYLLPGQSMVYNRAIDAPDEKTSLFALAVTSDGKVIKGSRKEMDHAKKHFAYHPE